MASERIKRKLKEWITDEWMLAGHNLTGGFEKSLEVKETVTDKGIRIDVLGNEYGIYTSEGVTANKIPYTPRRRGQGRGGTSKYIQGLVFYVQRRMGISNEREALGIAFAIAEKHSKNGMPKDGASKFLDKVGEKHLDELTKIVEEEFNLIIEKAWQSQLSRG